MAVTREKFFTLADGRSAELIKLKDDSGFEVHLTNFGGCITSIMVPDINGILTDVVLGWKTPEDYLSNNCYFGALIGRIPNRIANGRFILDGRVYQMCLNDNNRCTLHGGFGYSHRLWEIGKVSGSEVVLTLASPDGDGGFPGSLQVQVVYRLSGKQTLEMEITAECDRPTVADFTNHAYFNLDGESSGDTSGHHVIIRADRVTCTDEFLQATGEILPVDGTVYDLRQGKSFREIFREHDGGFDDNFILGDRDNEMHEQSAEVTAERSGIRMTVDTTRPGIQFYMGGFLNESGKSFYRKNSGFCLETQCWPNAVNHPHFPSVRLEPGKGHHSLTRYRFSLIK